MSNLKKKDITKARTSLRTQLQEMYDMLYSITEKADKYLEDLESLAKE